MMYLLFKPGQEELVAHVEGNICAFVERVQNSPRIQAFHQARAEAERTGSYEPIARFARRLKAGAYDCPR
jgi:hypothetical protein